MSFLGFVLTYQSQIVEIPIVVSSKTSKRTFTVSSDVKIVTLFWVAHCLISCPSLNEPLYIDGFGYVAPSKTKTIIVDSDGDINKMVGEMN